MLYRYICYINICMLSKNVIHININVLFVIHLYVIYILYKICYICVVYMLYMLYKIKKTYIHFCKYIYLFIYIYYEIIYENIKIILYNLK